MPTVENALSIVSQFVVRGGVSFVSNIVTAGSGIESFFTGEWLGLAGEYELSLYVHMLFQLIIHMYMHAHMYSYFVSLLVPKNTSLS